MSSASFGMCFLGFEATGLEKISSAAELEGFCFMLLLKVSTLVSVRK